MANIVAIRNPRLANLVTIKGNKEGNKSTFPIVEN